MASSSKNHLELDITDIVNFLDGVNLDTLCKEFTELLEDGENDEYRGKVEAILKKFQVTLTGQGYNKVLELVVHFEKNHNPDPIVCSFSLFEQRH